MLRIIPSNQFIKDLRLAKKRGMNIDKLREVINVLSSNGSLDKKYRDHSLTGQYKEFRECHIEPDWLLIYKITND